MCSSPPAASSASGFRAGRSRSSGSTASCSPPTIPTGSPPIAARAAFWRRRISARPTGTRSRRAIGAESAPASGADRPGPPITEIDSKSALQTRRGGGRITSVATKKPQTIAYPAPDARPRRHHDEPLDPHVIVLFGATGDLAKRKLIPGLAYLDQSELAPDIQIVATSLEDLTDDEFREIAKEAIDSFGTHKLTDEQWADFAKILKYVPQGAGPEALAAAVAEA